MRSVFEKRFPDSNSSRKVSPSNIKVHLSPPQLTEELLIRLRYILFYYLLFLS